MTYRQPVIDYTVAMVAPIFSGSAQSQHHLVPPPTFAQVLRQACEVTFGQSLELLYHLFTLVHSIETMNPKHDFHLDFQGQHTAKRLIPGINESSAVHDDRLQHELRSLYCLPLIHGFLGPITHSHQDLESHPKKCTHGGYPLESPLVIKLPHVMSLHQSAPLIKSLNHLARSASTHSSLIRQAIQDGELASVYCSVLYSNCCSLRYVKDSPPPADGP